MAVITQRSFSGGELTPFLSSRVDIPQYQAGLKKCRNFTVTKQGILQSRPGTVYVGHSVGDHPVRLIEFEFSDDDGIVLEIGHEYIRFIKDGAYIEDSSHSSGYYTVDTNYKSDSSNTEIFDINYEQSGDAIFLAHKNHPLQRLIRIADDDWEMDRFLVDIDSGRPGGIEATYTDGDKTVAYKITAINGQTNQESLPGHSDESFSINTIEEDSNNSNITIIKLSSSGRPPEGKIVIGDIIRVDTSIDALGGASGDPEDISYVTVTDLKIVSEEITEIHYRESDALKSYRVGVFQINGWTVKLAGIRELEVDLDEEITLFWDAVEGAIEYNIYKSTGGEFSFLGVSQSTRFTDIGETVSLGDTPPRIITRLTNENNYPGVVAIANQRLCLANKHADIEELNLSQVGRYNNFTLSDPIGAGDAISFRASSKKVNEIRGLLDMKDLVVFTSGGIWVLRGGEGAGITPFNINATPHSYFGCSKLDPLPIGHNALYVQSKRAIIRSLSFDRNLESYTSNDLTIFANHLFKGKRIVDWAYQESPDSIVWIVLDDGSVVALTHIEEQSIYAWHRHDFNGEVKSVTVIPGEKDDVVYFLINRTVDSENRRCIEYLSDREILDVKDYIGADSALVIDGTNTDNDHTLTISISGTVTDSSYTYKSESTLTSSDSLFTDTDTDKGKRYHLNHSDGKTYRFEIVSVTSSTVATVKPIITFPEDLVDEDISDWGEAVNKVEDLDHLEGLNVSVLGDGATESSPLNDSENTLTVDSGEIELSDYYVKIIIGLPITVDAETLDIEFDGNDSLYGIRKNISRTYLYLNESRGVWIGNKEPEDGVLDGLTVLKSRGIEPLGNIPDLKSEVVELNIMPRWSEGGRVFIRQVDPLPLSLLAITRVTEYTNDRR